MRHLLCLLGLLLLSLLAPTTTAQEGVSTDDDLVERSRAAWTGLERARAAAAEAQAALGGREQRLSELQELLVQELPSKPRGLASIEEFERADLKRVAEEAAAYLLALESRESLHAEALELLSSLTADLDAWKSRLEALAELQAKARALLSDLEARIGAGDLEVDFRLMEGGGTLAELIALISEGEAERAAWQAAIEGRRAKVEGAQPGLGAVLLPSAEDLDQAREVVMATELGLAIFDFEVDRVTQSESESAEVLTADLEVLLRQWSEGLSTYPTVLQETLDLRSALQEKEQALAELVAPEADSMDEEEGHPELRAARRALKVALAVEAFRERQLELLVEIRGVAKELLAADDKLGNALRLRALQAMTLSAKVRAAELRIERGDMEPREFEFDASGHWGLVKQLILEEVTRTREIERLEELLSNEEPVSAATRGLEDQARVVKSADQALEEELSYGALVDTMQGRSEYELIDMIRLDGSLAEELAASEEQFTLAQVELADSIARVEELLSQLDLLDSPHTQVEIERTPERAQQLYDELVKIASASSPVLPPDSSVDEERSRELSQPPTQLVRNESAGRSPLPTAAELAALEAEQVQARGRLQYFQEFEALVQSLRAERETLTEQVAACDTQLTSLIEQEQRRYAAAFELELRIGTGVISRFGVPRDLEQWTSRSAVKHVKGRRAEFRARFDELRERMRTDLERFDALLAWKQWAELGGEVAQEKVSVIARPVAHIRAASKSIEELKDYERENLIHLGHELESEERPMQFGLLATFGEPKANERFETTLAAYYLELVNNDRISAEYRQAGEAYEELIRLNLEYRAELQRTIDEKGEALVVRERDYQVVRYLAAIAARPASRIALRSKFRSEFEQDLYSGTLEGDLQFWANRLLSVEARLWGARRWSADLQHRLSRLGIESEISRYRMNLAQIEALLEEKRSLSDRMRARIVELREGRTEELKRAGLFTSLRIAIIPLLVMLALRVLRYFTGRMRVKAAQGADDELTDRRRRLETLTNVAGTSITVLVWIVAAIYILAALGLDVTPIIASASVMGLAIAFGAQALIKDYFSGFFILLEDQYTVGDIIDLGGANGTVEHISLRVTVMRDLSGVVHYVPNGQISRVANKTKKWSRVVMEVRVGFEEDLERVTGVIEDVLAEVQADAKWGSALLEPAEVLGVHAFGESAVDLRLWAKTQPGKQWAVSRELRRRIKDRFDREGIEIPVPQRVVQLHKE